MQNHETFAYCGPLPGTHVKQVQSGEIIPEDPLLWCHLTDMKHATWQCHHVASEYSPGLYVARPQHFSVSVARMLPSALVKSHQSEHQLQPHHQWVSSSQIQSFLCWGTSGSSGHQSYRISCIPQHCPPSPTHQ